MKFNTQDAIQQIQNAIIELDDLKESVEQINDEEINDPENCFIEAMSNFKDVQAYVKRIEGWLEDLKKEIDSSLADSPQTKIVFRDVSHDDLMSYAGIEGPGRIAECEIIVSKKKYFVTLIIDDCGLYMQYDLDGDINWIGPMPMSREDAQKVCDGITFNSVPWIINSNPGKQSA